MAQIGDILAKLGRGETLNSSEQQQIRLWGNNTEFNNSFVTGLQNGQSNLSVSTIRAISGEFEYPHSGVGMRLIRNTDVTLTTAVEYVVSFETKRYDDLNMWSLTDPTKVYFRRTGKYQVSLRALVSGGSSGDFMTYIKDTTSLLSTISVSSTSQHTLFVSDEVNFVAGEVMTIGIKQTSGADKYLFYYILTVRLLKSSDEDPGA